MTAQTAATSPSHVNVRPLGQGDWPLVETLFGEKGACGGCWCMYWRVPHGGQAFDALLGPPARSALYGLIEAGKVHALLAVDDGQPVGWLCLGPVGDFPRISTVKALRHASQPDTWTVVCLYLDRHARRKGLGTRLLAAAREYAFDHGASVLEGYPVTVRPGSRMADAFAWTGVPAMFERAGFSHVERGPETRGIWRASRDESGPPD